MPAAVRGVNVALTVQSEAVSYRGRIEIKFVKIGELYGRQILILIEYAFFSY